MHLHFQKLSQNILDMNCHLAPKTSFRARVCAVAKQRYRCPADTQARPITDQFQLSIMKFYMEEAGFSTCTSARYQEAIEVHWLPFWGAVMPSIFLYSLWFTLWNTLLPFFLSCSLSSRSLLPPCWVNAEFARKEPLANEWSAAGIEGRRHAALLLPALLPLQTSSEGTANCMAQSLPLVE